MNKTISKKEFFSFPFLVFCVAGLFLSIIHTAESAELEFVYPTEGMAFYANEPITVRVIAPTGHIFQKVKIRYPGKLVSEGEKTSPPYEFDVYLPLQVGPQKIVAEGKDQNGKWFTAEMTVNLIPRPLPDGVTLTQLDVFPPSIAFDHIPDDKRIHVMGVFSNGPIEQEITDPIFSTTYQIKSGGESVVSVSPRGLVTAKGVGQDAILVSNNGKTVEVPVTVQSLNSPPVIEPIANITMKAGEVVEVPVRVTDADGDSVTIKAFHVPAFGRFTDNGNGTGLLRLTPAITDREHTPISIIADDDGPLTLRGEVKFLLKVVAPETKITVSIDIKPGSSPNSINLKSKGVIPVVILNTGIFDPSKIDPLTVRFGPNGAAEAHGKGHIEDINGDGKPDMVLHFETQKTGIQCGQLSASLTGKTMGGEKFQGSDSIRTDGCP